MISAFVGSSASAGRSGWMLVTLPAMVLQAVRISEMAVGRSMRERLARRGIEGKLSP